MTMKNPIAGIFGRIKALALKDKKAWNRSLWNLAGSQSVSGENVTEETALTLAAVWNAVLLISQGIASLPLNLIEQQSPKKRTPAIDKKVHRVMHAKANPYMSAMALRETMAAHILTWGNGYAEKILNYRNEIIELWPIAPNRVNNIRMEGASLVYDIRVDNETITVPRERILHIPGLGYDGFIGYSVIAMARKSIGLSMAMETFGSLYFGQGTHPGVIVSHPGRLQPQARANLENSLTRDYSGLGRSHRLLLLEDAMKIENVGIPPEDSQFLQSRQFQIPEIARWFNIPPHKLKDLTRSSFSNIESEQISFYTDTLLPWLIRLEQAYNMQLLSEEEQASGKYYWKHNVDGILRGSSADRAVFYKTMWGFGFMTINEIRAKEDMDPNPSPLADELFVPANMLPLSKANEPRQPVQLPEPEEEQKPEETQAESVARIIHLEDRKDEDQKPQSIQIPGTGI